MYIHVHTYAYAHVCFLLSVSFFHRFVRRPSEKTLDANPAGTPRARMRAYIYVCARALIGCVRFFRSPSGPLVVHDHHARSLCLFAVRRCVREILMFSKFNILSEFVIIFKISNTFGIFMIVHNFNKYPAGTANAGRAEQ